MICCGLSINTIPNLLPAIMICLSTYLDWRLQGNSTVEGACLPTIYWPTRKLLSMVKKTLVYIFEIKMQSIPLVKVMSGPQILILIFGRFYCQIRYCFLHANWFLKSLLLQSSSSYVKSLLYEDTQQLLLELIQLVLTTCGLFNSAIVKGAWQYDIQHITREADTPTHLDIFTKLLRIGPTLSKNYLI